MTTLTILRGVPGAGKSTYARNMSGVTRVNRDDIRMALYNRTFGGIVDEQVVTQVEDAAIKASLAAGANTVVDATNLRNRYLRSKLSFASRYGAEVSFVNLPVPLEVAVENDQRRDNSVGRGVIEGFFHRYKIDRTTGILPPPPDFWPRFQPYVADRTKPSAYIVDTDGTVANHEGIRSPYDTTRYHLDSVREHVANVVRSLSSQGHAILALTGRDEDYREDTDHWWYDHEIPFDHLFMRPAGDKRPDAIVKYELFNQGIAPVFNVVGAFDDRPQVIRMWEAIGIPVFNVGTGDEF